MNDYETVRPPSKDSTRSQRYLSKEALHASWAEVDIPHDLVEQAASLLESRGYPLRLSEIILAVFGTPGIGQYSFLELRNQLNAACEQGTLVNLPAGQYAHPTHDYSSNTDKELVKRIRQAGVNPTTSTRRSKPGSRD